MHRPPVGAGRMAEICVSNRNHKAIFERRSSPDDEFVAIGAWELVCREWVSLMPLGGREYIEAQQTNAQLTHTAKATYAHTLSTVDTKCRMKIAKPTPVDESNEHADANYRIFHIERVLNNFERNRTIEFSVIEKV